MESGASRAAASPAPARPQPAAAPARTAPPAPVAQTIRAIENRRAAPDAGSGKPEAAGRQPETGSTLDPAQLKEAFLEEIRKQKKFFHGTVVAQAQRIDLQPDTITFVFGPQHRALRVQLEQTRPWLEETATRLAGRKVSVTSADGVASAGGPPSPAKPGYAGTAAAATGAAAVPDRQQELKERALADNGVQAMLDVFAAEIKDIEEM